jgi:hypothetical protein
MPTPEQFLDVQGHPFASVQYRCQTMKSWPQVSIIERNELAGSLFCISVNSIASY